MMSWSKPSKDWRKSLLSRKNCKDKGPGAGAGTCVLYVCPVEWQVSEAEPRGAAEMRPRSGARACRAGVPQ